MTSGTLATTFSTIAATVAGLYGLILTAAVFRITRIDQIAVNLSKKLSGTVKVKACEPELERIASVYLWKRFVDRWQEIDGTPKDGDTRYERTLWWLLSKIAYRLDWIRTLLLWGLALTLITVLACFVLVPFADDLVGNQSRSWLWAVIPVEVSAGACLVLYGFLITLLAINLKDFRG